MASPSQTYLTLKKANFCRVRLPNSLTFLNDADSAEWINNNYHVFDNVSI